MNYNLIEEKWIPVLWTNGKVSRVGIKDALTQAGNIRQIAASNPMDRFAIFRFLLATLYWCKGNPSEEILHDLTDSSFPASWFAKMDAEKECFNLFGETKRFYQFLNPGKEGLEKLSINYLIHEIPTGSNKWHFRHSTDHIDGLCPACCAMGLLRLPLFATSGGRGKPPAINAKPPIYVAPMGFSLASTLRFSWQETSKLGTPFWENPTGVSKFLGEVPFLVGLTWLPRQIWLDQPEGFESKCISCGRQEHLIKQCIFAGIGSTKTVETSQEKKWTDPHVLYVKTNKGDGSESLHASNALGANDAAAGQWTKILSGIIQKREILGRARNVWVVGFSTVQNDKYLEAKEFFIPTSNAENLFSDILEKIGKWQKEYLKVINKSNPKKEDTAKKRKHSEIPATIAAIRPHVENQVSAKIDELLTGDENAWEQAAKEYSPLMGAVAKSLAPGFTSGAVQRQRQIAIVKPDMREKAVAENKPAKKKGDEQ
ncbi:MAG: type I-E CRISPR-associated protein Cse1/CasA [Myxococcales bacterium]|nr:type I-E CRISPR-associated protein Cse1/CasA [Myxococcales bacterium]